MSSVPGKVLALDPGTEETGWAMVFAGPPAADSERAMDFRVLGHGILTNRAVLESLASMPADELVIEQPVGYGARAGLELLDAARWAGRFEDRWETSGYGFARLLRFTAVSHALLGRAGGETEGRVWAALCDRFGGAPKACAGRRCLACKGTTKRRFGRGKAAVVEECGVCATDPGWHPARGLFHGIHADARSAVAVAFAHLIKLGLPV